MPDIPDCLHKRYTILNDLINDLEYERRMNIDSGTSLQEPSALSTNDVAIKLMCDLWQILKDNPDYDLSDVIRDRNDLSTPNSTYFGKHNFQLFMADISRDDASGSKKDQDDSKAPSSSHQKASDENADCCNASKSVVPNDSMPLSKVLCNLKEAASFDRRCEARLIELMETEKGLTSQIAILEKREKEGIALLKKADCMWSCMENTYKKKIAEFQNKQVALVSQVNQLERSVSKWRKHKNDLEIEMNSIMKCKNEIKEKTNDKNNDLKMTDKEIESLKNKMKIVQEETESVKHSLNTRKAASDKKIENYTKKMQKYEKELKELNYKKSNKEGEGDGIIRDIRDDITTLGKQLVNKQLKTIDLKSERDSLNIEIDLLKEAANTCQASCNAKRDSIFEEIAKVNKEIGDFKVQCIQCHQCCNTTDLRKLCVGCARCGQQHDCLYDKDKCYLDHTEDCICMKVKQDLMDNVFENMSTVLERQVRTKVGKAVAESVLHCLKRSKNGKVDGDTRRMLQDFILTTIRKNLNLTIVGGAIKTRCEMDADTYKQLMVCLKQVKESPISKADKGLAPKKDACSRWGGPNECNCPKGPKNCICSRKAPKPAKEPPSSPPSPPDKDDKIDPMTCPYIGKPCGSDCAQHALSGHLSSGSEIQSWKIDPCKTDSCTYSKNMRAAQCAVGAKSPEDVSATLLMSKDDLNLDEVDTDKEKCMCRDSVSVLCPRQADRKRHKRKLFFDDAMGRYDDLSGLEDDRYTILSYDSIDMEK